ncbi:uncharacterized protein K444DRAFT_307530 [Hyaloscypha bicolor E]|uniref:Uncharacterized protein n=1 Tax=Hyaloscypha bicolor E TaxID=1095630 RepID=A0A2J6TMM0_9HELO|nr:uncharacterized protein K444DRAFT_307530 [Hyaloscypha bicolor E]PMD64218.1 hypothetical protein K444DRAFT_307530 [Hyaloscypha bicolor E]
MPRQQDLHLDYFPYRLQAPALRQRVCVLLPLVLLRRARGSAQVHRGSVLPLQGLQPCRTRVSWWCECPVQIQESAGEFAHRASPSHPSSVPPWPLDLAAPVALHECGVGVGYRDQNFLELTVEDIMAHRRFHLRFQVNQAKPRPLAGLASAALQVALRGLFPSHLGWTEPRSSVIVSPAAFRHLCLVD